ncbi:hypothetical protein NLG97_g298 [Lecanicillium saksenae]|uniref:Uncharacterized protein n=1 Tax=Lecanicillium saksenae TaxID=468837 RepID=A0ACC1R7K0_9HYPO|nr:hypothetical protein NLG97_g298 [Lecanicillium saksenae]
MLPKLSVWISILSVLCLNVFAGGVPGGLERVHLWEAYDLAWDWKGKDQAYLFPNFQDHKKIGTRAKYPAADPSGRFTFQEFMHNMDNKECTIEPPDESKGRSALTVAKELDAAGFNKDINGKGFNRGLESKAKKEKKSYYFVLHEMVASMVEDMLKDDKFMAKEGVKDRIAGLKKIPPIIESIRVDDFQNWLKGDLTRSPDATKKVNGKDVPNPGFGLKDDEVVTHSVTNPHDGETYQRVDIDETVKKMKANPDYGKKKVADFENYAKQYGDNKWKFNDPKVTFVDAAISHFQTLTFWGRIKERFNKCVLPA